MATSLKDTTRASMLGAIVSAIGASGHLLIYTGSAPAKTAAPTGTLLATFVLASTPGTVSGGVLTMANVTSVTGSASGTPGYYRCIDGATDDGTHTQIQGSAGVGSGDINFASTIASGGTVGITNASWTYTDANN